MKCIKMITINMPPSLVIKLKMILRILTGRPVNIISMEDIVREWKIEQAELKKFLKDHRPFNANRKN